MRVNVFIAVRQQITRAKDVVSIFLQKNLTVADIAVGVHT
jgi:hypothetical protein